MKKIASILLLVAVFATMFSLTAFAAENANVFTITADKTAVSAGEDVIVTVELSGDLADVAMVQFGIKYDTEKFDIATAAVGRPPVVPCWESAWYAGVTNYEGLGYMAAPSIGKADGVATVLYVDTQYGFSIDSSSPLYGDNKTTVAAKLKFTALADVETIDASCLSLVDDAALLLVTESDKSSHTTSAVQIESAPADTTVYGTEAVKCANTWTTAKSTTDALTHTFSNVAVATATCPATATEAGFKFGKGAAPADTAAKAPVAFDAKYVDGAGNVEYTAVMFNVDYDGDIYALSYYVPAN